MPVGRYYVTVDALNVRVVCATNERAVHGMEHAPQVGAALHAPVDLLLSKEHDTKSWQPEPCYRSHLDVVH
jgi:hypothetical protein